MKVLRIGKVCCELAQASAMSFVDDGQ